jgi:site-specific DNA recombinase
MGGLPELLSDARRTPRPFNRVICENINRVARTSLAAFQIEDELRQAGVTLHCANEPFDESFASIVLRHVNVGLAVGYHRELMTQSRKGYETATYQGWHMGGIACYGYQLVPHPHPNPHKARRGLVRHTLDLDMVRGPVARRIWDEALYGTGGLREIRDLLNTDLERFPSPDSPDPARALGVWSMSSVREILHNPKYTGFQVWNRRARKDKTRSNRPNPPEAWVWSEAPSHPAIISIDEFKQMQAKFERNTGSRRAEGTPTSPRPANKKNEYVFRSRLHCGICGLRMWGHRRRATRYYNCQPSHQRGAGIPQGHPPLVYLGERPLIEAVTRFLAKGVYGPDRYDYWVARLASADTTDPAAPAHARALELEDEIRDLERRVDRQVLSLEDNDVSVEFRRRVAMRVTQLEHDLTQRRASLAKLQPEQTTLAPDPSTVERLLHSLPLLTENLADLPQTDLRRLFDSLDLTCIYDPAARLVDLTITLVGAQGDDSQVRVVPSAGFEPAAYCSGGSRSIP